jgi:hypothetical protein
MKTCHCPRNRLSIVKIHTIFNRGHNCYSNSQQFTPASVHVLTSLQFFICHLHNFVADDKFATKHDVEGRGINYQSNLLFTKLLHLRTLYITNNSKVLRYYHRLWSLFKHRPLWSHEERRVRGHTQHKKKFLIFVMDMPGVWERIPCRWWVMPCFTIPG